MNESFIRYHGDLKAIYMDWLPVSAMMPFPIVSFLYYFLGKSEPRFGCSEGAVENIQEEVWYGLSAITAEMSYVPPKLPGLE